MTYAAFTYYAKKNLPHLSDAVSLSTFRPSLSFSISSFSLDYLMLHLKMSSNLSKFIAFGLCGELNQKGVTILKFNKKLASDKNLVSIGKNYLGCILSVPKKTEFGDRIRLISRIHQNQYIRHNFIVHPGEFLDDSLKKRFLTSCEIEELHELHPSLYNPIDQWAEKREKNLRTELAGMPSLLTRNF